MNDASRKELRPLNLPLIFLVPLIFLRRRVLAHQLGMFLTRDPLTYVDGMNLYVYAKNSPLNYVDPFGTATFRVKRVVTTRGPIARKSKTLIPRSWHPYLTLEECREGRECSDCVGEERKIFKGSTHGKWHFRVDKAYWSGRRNDGVCVILWTKFHPIVKLEIAATIKTGTKRLCDSIGFPWQKCCYFTLKIHTVYAHYTHYSKGWTTYTGGTPESCRASKAGVYVFRNDKGPWTAETTESKP